MKLTKLLLATCVLTFGATSAAFAQVAPPPAPMEGGSPVANEVATRYGVMMTTQQDWFKAVGALLQDYNKVSGELHAAKTELARKDALSAAPPAAPAAAPAPAPAPGASASPPAAH